MKIITINVHENMIKIFKKLVDKDYATSRSDLIRKLIDYALPRFLGIQETYDKMVDDTLDITQFEKPEPVKYENLTLAESREKFPEMVDYKYINEEAVKSVLSCQ